MRSPDILQQIILIYRQRQRLAEQMTLSKRELHDVCEIVEQHFFRFDYFRQVFFSSL